MATKKPKVVTRRKVETVRERADKEQAKKDKKPRTRKVAGAASKPVIGASKVLKKEYNPIKLPETKVTKHLTKSRSWIPPYFKKSWAELKQVTWPTMRVAANLTVAVIIFSVVLALFVRLIDYGFEKLFREVIL